MITSSSSTSISTTTVPLPPSKISCFNTKCSSSTNLVNNNTDNSKLLSPVESSSQSQKPQQQQQQKVGIGWRLRSGEHAQLCTRCSGIYEQGTFCDIFHLDSDGWRKCQTCAKRVHCGCIVSFPLYMLLDYGGIECISCARKTLSVTPNSIWPPSSLLSSQMLERTKEPVKSWNQLSSSFSGQWRNGHHLWNTGTQSDLQQRLSLEFDRPLHSERMIASIRPSMSINDKKVNEPSGALNMYREEDNDLAYARRSVPSDSGSARSALPLSSTKGDPSSILTGLNAHFPSMNQSQNHIAPLLPKKSSRNSHNNNDTSVEAHSGRSRVDAKTRAQLLPRYWPRITDQELQQISGDSNAIITPLFEKMLSASDAGRIGRLVLPKKCAEAYFPPIFHPEGVPLKVQDAGGNEWLFQFRFWPNNNSRMYVLEGVTPCIQSMQLQAGDTVTFSRIDPEGKLVMGFRKANSGPSDQDTQTVITNNNISTPPNGSKSTGDSTVNASITLSSQKGGTESRNLLTAADGATMSKIDQAGIKQNDGSPIKSSQGRIRRRGNTLGSKNKRLRIENEDKMELNVTWEEAQELLRPHPDQNPSIVVIEGHEIEEFEEAPVIGKPSIFTKDQAGNSSQWAQCENCFKWRKLPVDALLTLVWTCSKNKWDSERSSCSSVQEVSKELTYVLLHTGSMNPNSKVENNGVETSDGLDTLANLAILEEGNLVSSQTTKHPRHRPGCTCIVCIQPPSGKGPKHKETCECNVCLTVKRRFKTLMLRRERKQSEKESSALLPPLPPQSIAVTNAEEADEDNDRNLATLDSPLKAQIDLNIQPEREEEPSPKAEAATISTS